MTDVHIIPFLFEGEQMVRVVDLRDDKLWVVAKDVAQALGYKDTAKAVTAHCKHGRTISGKVGDSPTFPLGIHPQTIIISEGDVYRLVLRSNLPTAERFEVWVMDEVLPTIRRTGRYETSAAASEIEDEEVQTADGLKLRKINTAARIFGERAGAQLWLKLGLEMVPAMRPILAQLDLLEIETVSVTTKVSNGGAH